MLSKIAYIALSAFLMQQTGARPVRINFGSPALNVNVKSASSLPLATASDEKVPRVPLSPVPTQETEAQIATNVALQCCCIPNNQPCAQEEVDMVDSGLINARLSSSRVKRQISTRIVNISPAQEEQNACAADQKSCCYDTGVDVSAFARSGCITPNTNSNTNEAWQQIGNDIVGLPTTEGKFCGERSFSLGASLKHGEASVGEFPWTCLLLNQDNDFLGSCVIIPDNSNNDNSRATRKVLTAAHKLSSVEENDLIKVRVGEYDASGFNAPESFRHEEYTVTRILKHPEMSNTRLSNDLALLYVDSDINLNHPYVNTACLPACADQFDHQFSNGTGVRCFVAGWGKDDFNGNFQFIQKKVDLPLVQKEECESKLKIALDNQQAGTGDRFSVDDSEICAGGQVGKDACTGDGGSPLVCQAESGRWSVVGLVAWGVGCASEIPGVYVNIASFLDWINFN